MLQTLEEQVAGERQRLVETHLARVVATLNNNRRLALESYLTAVQSDPPQVTRSIHNTFTLYVLALFQTFKQVYSGLQMFSHLELSHLLLL